MTLDARPPFPHTRGRRRPGNTGVATRARAKSRRWSARVSKTSNSLDLKAGIFKQRSARAIAASLKRAALASKRRKAAPFQSAMSMLNFEINRAGRGLSGGRRHTLENAKTELRKLFGRSD